MRSRPKRNSLGQVAKDAATAAEREKGSMAIIAVGGTSSLMRAFCSSAAAAVPTFVPAAQKYQSAAADWNAGANDTGRQCLKFSLEEPQYYQYWYSSGDVSASTGNFNATANGDLNGNSILSTFTVSGLAFSGAIAISPNIQETYPEE
jgi:hypothetical protein